MCNVVFVEVNWKKVVTLKAEHDDLMLCNFLNNTGSSEGSVLKCVGPLALNIGLALM